MDAEGLAGVERVVPMLPQQQAFLFVHLLGEASDTAASELVAVLDGRLDVDAFTRAWTWAVNRHEILRSSFVWEGVSQPLQIVHRHVGVDVPVVDVSLASSDDRPRLVEAALSGRPLNLREAPLWRLALVRTGEDETEVRWRSHHVLLDGWSFDIVVSEVFEVYAALRSGRQPSPSPAVGTSAFGRWLDRLDRTSLANAWRTSFEGWPGPTAIPASDPSGSEPLERSQLATCRVGGDAARALTATARRHRISPAAVLFAAWAVVLARQVDSDDVTFGIVTSGRPATLPGADRMVGAFARTLPFRLQVPWEREAASWLVDVGRRLADTIAVEHASLGEIRRWTGAAPEEDLLRCLVLFQNQPATRDLGGGLSLRSIEVLQETAFPLTLVAVPEPEDLGLALSYRAPIDAVTADCLLGQVAAALSSLSTGWAGALVQDVALGPPDQLRVAASFGRGGIRPPGSESSPLQAGTRWALVGRDDRPRPLGAPGLLVHAAASPSGSAIGNAPLAVHDVPGGPLLRLSGDGNIGPWENPRHVRSSAGAMVSLDDIEAAVKGAPGVGTVVVFAEDGTGAVVARCEPERGGSLTPEAIWEHLLRTDVASMPDRVVVLGENEGRGSAPGEDRTDLLLVAEIWEDLLDVEDIGPDDDFFELGGDSLLGIQLLERLQAAFAVDLDLDGLLIDPTPRGTVANLRGTADRAPTHAADAAREERDALQRDATPDPGVEEDRPLTVHPALLRVVVTGADTFVGAHLAVELLGRGVPQLHLLDARSGPSALDSTIRRWKEWGLWQDGYQDRLRFTRVRLGSALLGLDTDAWDDLAASTDCIFHLGGGRDGAIAPYAEMSRLNVQSTRTLLTLATGHHPKALHVLSTLHCATPRKGAIAEAVADRPPALLGPYASTKWAVEQLVTAAAQRGVFARAYRVGEVAYSSRNGSADEESLLVRLLRSSLEIGVAPRGTFPAILSSAEHCAEALVSMAQLPRAETPAVVNVVDPSRPTAAPLRLASLLKNAGISLEERNHATWRSLVSAHAAREPAAAVLPRTRAKGVAHHRGGVRAVARDVALWSRHIGRRYEVDCTSALAAGVPPDRVLDPDVLERVARHLAPAGAPDVDEGATVAVHR